MKIGQDIYYFLNKLSICGKLTNTKISKIIQLKPEKLPITKSSELKLKSRFYRFHI